MAAQPLELRQLSDTFAALLLLYCFLCVESISCTEGLGYISLVNREIFSMQCDALYELKSSLQLLFHNLPS